VIQSRQRLGLALEALQELRILGQVLAQHLDGHFNLPLGVGGQENVGHAAAA